MSESMLAAAIRKDNDDREVVSHVNTILQHGMVQTEQATPYDKEFCKTAHLGYLRK